MYRAHLLWRYSPKPAVRPAHATMKHPSMIPVFENVEGIARRPAPRTRDHSIRYYPRWLGRRAILVLTRLITLLAQVAWPTTPTFFLPLRELHTLAHVPRLDERHIPRSTPSQRARACGEMVGILRFSSDSRVAGHPEDVTGGKRGPGIATPYAKA